ncbi:hypothetical protein ADICEAN_04186 [Cesiribacter andamanensis AMV16]|uniref:Uncharacterized protein n=1 Tax=Cesiribacter andamanensis AMV16 TaxID=1279009 RepID=M7N0E8_9BACT|nr:hypothetical protein ADICEAN_04186 [Cesiribacter andamanensis AMV16]
MVGKFVLILAAYAPALRHILGCFAHAEGVVGFGQFGIGKAPADGGIVDLGRAAPGGFGFGHHKGGPCHALYPAGDVGGAIAPLQGTAGIDDGLQAGSAQAVYRYAADLYRQAGHQGGHAGHVAVIFTGLVGGAKDYFFQYLRGKLGVALQQLANH